MALDGKLQPKQALVYDDSWGPPMGQEGLQKKIAQVVAAVGDWQKIWQRVDENYQMLWNNQYTEAQTEMAKSQGRELTAFNIIDPMIRNMVGRMVSTKRQWRILPKREGPDAEYRAELVTDAVNAVAEVNDYVSIEERLIFEDACAGIGWGQTMVDVTGHDMDTLSCGRVDYHEIMFDLASRSPSLKDARWLARCVMRTLPEAAALYPDKIEVLKKYRRMTPSNFQYSPWFQRANAVAFDQYYMPIVEYWERRIFPVWELVDEMSEDVTTSFATQQEAEHELGLRMAQYAQMEMMAMQNGIEPQTEVPTITLRSEEKIVQTCFIGVDLLCEEVIEMDDFPYVPCFLMYHNGQFRGAIDIIKDLQLFFNRTAQQMDHIQNSAMKNLTLYKLGGFPKGTKSEQLRREFGRTAPFIQIDDEADFDEVVKVFPNGQFPQGLEALANLTLRIVQMIMPQESYSGSPVGSQGGSSDQSGRALAIQSNIGDLTLKIFYDSLDYFRKQLGRRLVFNMKRMSYRPLLFQALGTNNAVKFIALNRSDADTIYDEDFEVAVTSEDYSPTAQLTQNAQVMSLLQNQAVMNMLTAPVLPPKLEALLEIAIRTMKLPEELKELFLNAPAMPPLPPGTMPGAPAPPGGSPMQSSHVPGQAPGDTHQSNAAEMQGSLPH